MTKSTIKKLRLIIPLLLFVHHSASAIVYYSRANGNWNVNSTWSTATYGSGINTGTYPKAGDIAYIGNGYTISISSAISCATLNVGQGISGTLQFLSTSTYSAQISGNVTVNTGAKIWYNTPVNRNHSFYVGGNFANYGTVDFYYAAGQVVNLTFNGSTNSVVSGTGFWDLNYVVMSKTASINTELNVQTNNFESGIKSMIATYGTYVHNNTGAYAINPTTATFTIGPNVIFKVPMGLMLFASNADNLVLRGGLHVNGGSVFVGKSNGLQGIRTDRSGSIIPNLNVTSGNLIVYGGITYNTTSASEPFQFQMTGGNILLNAGTSGTNRQVFFVTDIPGSSFTMTGGTITIQKPSTGGILNPDFSICGINGSVTTTGGTVQFGNGVTASGANFNFKPFPTVTQPHFRISGQSGVPNTLATSYSSTYSFKLLSLTIDASKTFDVRSIGGTAGDTKTMTLLSTANGTDALYNNGTFTARQSTVTFNTTGAQAIGGTSTTSFYNLSINNGSNITLNRSAIVTNYLSMVNGKLISTATNLLTCSSTANASLGASNSYVDGPMVHTFAGTSPTAKTFPIGKGSSHRPAVLTITHTNSTPVTYRGEVFNSPATALPFSNPPTISNVSQVRYLRFNRQSVANFSSGTIQMYYDIDDVVADKNTLNIAHDDGVSAWVNIGGTATANWTGNVTSSSFTSFNTYFALANPPGGGNPLPIELTSFSAYLSNQDVTVKWTTQAEVNNDYFNIERSSDNISYETIGTVDAAGNSSHETNYMFVDQEPLSGISYYRLTQTDIDGNVERFAPTVIDNRKRVNFSVYPNPSSSGIVNLSGSSNGSFSSITVQDITGKVIPSEFINRENGIQELHINDYYTSRGGIFIVSVLDGDRSYRQKLLIE